MKPISPLKTSIETNSLQIKNTYLMLGKWISYIKPALSYSSTAILFSFLDSNFTISFKVGKISNRFKQLESHEQQLPATSNKRYMLENISTKLVMHSLLKAPGHFFLFHSHVWHFRIMPSSYKYGKWGWLFTSERNIMSIHICASTAQTFRLFLLIHSCCI
jgi:hypothetical protein